MSEPNKMRWDLESIFPGGSGSTEYKEFRKAINVDLTKAQKTLKELSFTLDEVATTKWIAFMLMVQDIAMRVSHAESFAGCLQAQDVSDDRAMDILGEVTDMYASVESVMTEIDAFAMAVGDDDWNKLMSHEKLSGAAFYWNERRQVAKLKMEPKLEKLATKLAVSGYHGWCLLYEKMAGDLRTEFEEDGETKALSMGQLHNKFSSPDREVRKQAFEKLEETWKSVEGLTAMTLNSQAGYRLALYEGREWESAVFEPLLINRIGQGTLDAMWNAVAGARDKISEYISAKKKLLGIDDFCWYDQIAPLGDVEKKVSWEEACDFTVRHLSEFSKELGDFSRMAVDKRWLEAEDRSGKAAGGFCTGFPVIGQTRIFMTFSGDYQQIMTLAHELGHSYHSWVLKDRDYFARSYTMSLAETASNFNEQLVTDAALEAAENDSDRLSLLDNKVKEGFVLFCNLYCRYLFDVQFYQERKKGVVSKERLGEIMLEAQRQAFGDILADDGYHSLFWASKMHFFDTFTPFYNFPYTFGFLFAGGIYDLARKEGPAFAESYRALLADTGSMTTEEVAKKHLGVDLTQDDFWNDAVGRVVMDVDRFVRMAVNA